MTLKIPTIAGFIVAGMLVGPKGLGLVNDMHQVKVLAEIGVALLLFGIGLEFPLDRLRRLWRLVLIGGLIQIGIANLLTVVIGVYDLISIPIAIAVAMFWNYFLNNWWTWKP